MPEFTKHEEGTFSWADLATTDVAAATDFYKQIFGWAVSAEEIPGGGMYYMFKIDGKDVAAASDLQENERNMGVPPHWNAYFTVEDVDQSAKVAESAGGSVVAPPFDVMDVGRMAVIADPNGAMFCLWQPRTNIGAQLMGDDNTLGWAECMAPDRAKAVAFYNEVLGTSSEDFDMGVSSAYTVLKVGDTSIAGVMEPNPNAAGMPPAWLVYFNVADCDETAGKVKSLGGQTFMEPTTIEMAGRVAVVSDPQGAAFGLLEPQPMP